MNTYRSLILSPLVAAACLSVQAQEAPRSSFTTGFDHTTGKYGTGRATDISTVLVSAKTVSGLWSFGLTLPYLRVSGPGDVIPEIGSVPRQGVQQTDRTESGLGDIVVSATCVVLDSPDRLFLDVTGKIKLPSADEDKGLGSGESDRHLQADAYREFGDTTVFGTVGYRALGDPPGFILKDGFYTSGGASYRLSPETSVGGMLDLRQKTYAEGDAAVELTGFVTRRLNEKWRVQGYVLQGFTDASPDYGIGGMATYTF